VLVNPVEQGANALKVPIRTHNDFLGQAADLRVLS
jgi:hypothetical protein